MKYYEDLIVDEVVTFAEAYTVTEEEIIEMGKRWDPQPFHIDPIAAKDSIFGGLVASSAHIFNIYVYIGNQEIDRDKNVKAVSALGFNNLQWHAPVRPNDVLRCRYKVDSKRVSNSRPNLGIITSSSEVFNQKNEITFTLDCSYLVERRNPSED